MMGYYKEKSIGDGKRRKKTPKCIKQKSAMHGTGKMEEKRRALFRHPPYDGGKYIEMR